MHIVKIIRHKIKKKGRWLLTASCNPGCYQQIFASIKKDIALLFDAWPADFYDYLHNHIQNSLNTSVCYFYYQFIQKLVLVHVHVYAHANLVHLCPESLKRHSHTSHLCPPNFTVMIGDSRANVCGVDITLTRQLCNITQCMYMTGA